MKPNNIDSYEQIPPLSDDEFLLDEFCNDFPEGDDPYRAEHCYITVCRSGRADVQVNMTHHVISKNKLLMLFPGQIVSLRNISSDFSFSYVRLSATFLNEILFRFSPSFVGFIRENQTHQMDERNFDEFRSLYFEPLKHHCEDRENIFRREIVTNTLRNFFMDAHHKIKRDESLEHLPRSRKSEIMEQFCALVMKNFRTSRKVQFYADKLHITPKHLSSIVKELDSDHRTAKEWIDSYCVVEVKLLIKSTDLSMQEIANELNFPNQSFFCKYFKHLTGLSPKEYRET